MRPGSKLVHIECAEEQLRQFSYTDWSNDLFQNDHYIIDSVLKPIPNKVSIEYDIQYNVQWLTDYMTGLLRDTKIETDLYTNTGDTRDTSTS